MAVDLFLKIDGIDGESQKDGHKGEIDIDSFSFGAVQHGSFHTGGGGGGSGKAEITDISISKQVDKASATLYKFCASGKHIPKVVLYSQKAGDGEKPLTYYTITLDDVIVSNIQNSGSNHGDSILESVSFNTAKLTFEYQAQGKDGAKDGGVVKASYDVRENKVA
jgi:type VI secretion system secreted protein Hcp